MRGCMKHFTFDNHWAAIQGQLKQRYAQLTDDDLLFVEGKGEELLARLRQKLALSADALSNLLAEMHSEALAKWEQVKDKVTDLAADARKQAGDLADNWKDKAAAVGEEVKAKTSACCDQAMQRARTFHEDGEEYVRLHPGKSVFVAVCAGFVAGLLIRR